MNKKSKKVNHYIANITEEGLNFIQGLKKLESIYNNEVQKAVIAAEQAKKLGKDIDYDTSGFVEKMAAVYQRIGFAQTAQEMNFYDLPKDKQDEAEQKCFEILDNLTKHVPEDIILEQMSFLKDCKQSIQAITSLEDDATIEGDIKDMFKECGEYLDPYVAKKNTHSIKKRPKGGY